MAASEKNMTIKSLLSPLIDPVSDLAEMGLDMILPAINESGVVRELPLIKYFIAAGKFGSAVQNLHFIKKYGAFIGVISRNLSSEERGNLIEEMAKDPELADKITEKTIIALDRFHDELKAKLSAQLLIKTMKEKVFSITEYNKLLFSIEMIHPVDGLECLKSYYRYYVDFKVEEDKEKRDKIWMDGANLDFSSLATTGLVNLPSGATVAGGMGGASLNDLGVRFFEEVYCCLDKK